MFLLMLLTILRYHPSRRSILFILGLLFVGYMQWTCYRAKVAYIDPNLFSVEARELKVTHTYRYGFVETYHGAVLVRTRNVPLRVSREPKADEMWRAMNDELKLAPLKLTLETAFYLVMLLYGFFLAPWVAMRIQVHGRRLVWHLCCVALLWAVGWTMLAAPLLINKYGEPIYSTWVGPGALSYSGPHLEPSFGNGMTVSYRNLFEVVAPSITAAAVAQTGLLRHVPNTNYEIYLWLLGTIFYGTLGVGWERIASLRSTVRHFSICPVCNAFVERPQHTGAFGFIIGRCRSGHIVYAPHSSLECALVGVGGCIAWLLIATELLDVNGVQGMARIALASTSLVIAAAYGIAQMCRGVKYRRSSHPTSRLAKCSLAVGAGICGYLATDVLVICLRH